MLTFGLKLLVAHDLPGKVLDVADHRVWHHKRGHVSIFGTAKENRDAKGCTAAHLLLPGPSPVPWQSGALPGRMPAVPCPWPSPVNPDSSVRNLFVTQEPFGGPNSRKAVRTMNMYDTWSSKAPRVCSLTFPFISSNLPPACRL